MDVDLQDKHINVKCILPLQDLLLNVPPEFLGDWNHCGLWTIPVPPRLESIRAPPKLSWDSTRKAAFLTLEFKYQHFFFIQDTH